MRGGNSALYRGTYSLRWNLRAARQTYLFPTPRIRRLVLQRTWSRAAPHASCMHTHARSTATRFLCASKRWHVTVSYRGGAGKINFAKEGRKRTRKRASEKGQQRCGMVVEPVQARVVYEMEGKGVRFPAHLLAKRSVRRIAIQTFSAHFFVPPAGELTGLFLDEGDGRWGIGLWFAHYRGQKRKPTNLAARSKNASRQELVAIKKKYMYTFDFSANVFVKRSSRRTRGLLFIHVRMPLSRDVCRSLSIFPTGTEMRNIYHYFIQRVRCEGDAQIKNSPRAIVHYIWYICFKFPQIFSTMCKYDPDSMHVHYTFTVLKQGVSWKLSAVY